jgi:uncharacterized protein
VRLSFEHVFDIPAEELFAFHENPSNLTVFLRGWRTFRMVSNDGHIRVGSITRVQERMGLIWVPMTFEHFVYDPPRRFAERQVRGPFKKLEHIHEFEEAGSGTRVRDLLEVALPWYLGGDLATRLFVVPKFRRFFLYRYTEMERLLREGKLS